MKTILSAVIWIVLLGVFALFYFGGRKNKKKYAGKSMEPTRDWYEQCQSRCGADGTKKAYYFEYDKNYLTQGHVMVDQNRKPVYEAKILYGDVASGYETDFTNHLIGYTHHHNISAASSVGMGRDRTGIAVSSTFDFDGVSIWAYLESLGYDYHFTRINLAYRIDVSKNGVPAGTLYSSNGGKNYFGCTGPIQPKMGGKGLLVVECADRDADALFLYAMAFTRTELSMENLNH